MCAQRILRSASTQSDQSLRCPHEESLGPRLIWVLAGRTVILLVLSWGGSYIKLPSSGDFRSQWPPESRRVPRGCNCLGVCSYIDAQELLLRHMFLDCNCIYKHFVETKNIVFRFKPPHDKTNKMTVRPAKTKISLGIRPVWSESSLCSQWVAKDPSLLHGDSEDSDQTGRSLRWAHSHFVGFVMGRLIFRTFIVFFFLFYFFADLASFQII